MEPGNKRAGATNVIQLGPEATLEENAVSASLLMGRKTYVSGHICSAINRASVPCCRREKGRKKRGKWRETRSSKVAPSSEPEGDLSNLPPSRRLPNLLSPLNPALSSLFIFLTPGPDFLLGSLSSSFFCSHFYSTGWLK